MVTVNIIYWHLFVLQISLWQSPSRVSLFVLRVYYAAGAVPRRFVSVEV